MQRKKETGYVNTLFQREFVITVIFQQSPDVYSALFAKSLLCNSVLQAVSWKVDVCWAGAEISGLNIHFHMSCASWIKFTLPCPIFIFYFNIIYTFKLLSSRCLFLSRFSAKITHTRIFLISARNATCPQNIYNIKYLPDRLDGN